MFPNLTVKLIILWLILEESIRSNTILFVFLWWEKKILRRPHDRNVRWWFASIQTKLLCSDAIHGVGFRFIGVHWANHKKQSVPFTRCCDLGWRTITTQLTQEELASRQRNRQAINDAIQHTARLMTESNFRQNWCNFAILWIRSIGKFFRHMHRLVFSLWKCTRMRTKAPSYLPTLQPSSHDIKQLETANKSDVIEKKWLSSRLWNHCKRRTLVFKSRKKWYRNYVQLWACMCSSMSCNNASHNVLISKWTQSKRSIGNRWRWFKLKLNVQRVLSFGATTGAGPSTTTKSESKKKKCGPENTSNQQIIVEFLFFFIIIFLFVASASTFVCGWFVIGVKEFLLS